MNPAYLVALEAVVALVGVAVVPAELGGHRLDADVVPLDLVVKPAAAFEAETRLVELLSERELREAVTRDEADTED